MIYFLSFCLPNYALHNFYARTLSHISLSLVGLNPSTDFATDMKPLVRRKSFRCRFEIETTTDF